MIKGVPCVLIAMVASFAAADCSVNSNCGSCLGASCSWCAAKNMCRSASSFAFCAGDACVSASIPGCASTCPGAPTPAPPPPAPSSCPDDETACYSTVGCGYCIDDSYDGTCLAGDTARPFSLPAGQGNCTKQWTPGAYRAAGSMCVMAISDYDTRCYADCSYGEGIGETFVVPSSAACATYDSAFKSTQAKPADRKRVHEHISSYLLQQAVAQAALALERECNATGGVRVGDMTRQYIASGLQSLETKGLTTFESGCCAYFTGDAAGFCSWSFTKDAESYVNKAIESIPLVKNVNNWLVNTANELVPSGVRNVVDDVADAYNAGKRVVDACESAGKAIVHGLFGWL